MADEDVIAGTGEQAPVEESHVDADLDVPTGDVDGGAVGDGQTSDEGAAVLPVETAPESIDALLERYPSLREQHESKLKERENAGAQRREAQLKREAGATENTRRNVTRFLTDMGVDPTELLMLPDGRTQLSRVDYLYSLAAANSAYELAQQVPDTILRNHPVPVEVREQAIEARERGDWDGYVSTLLNGAAEAKDVERQKTFDAKVTAEVNKRLAAEIKARELEKAPRRDPMPVMPAGTTSTAVPYHLLTREQRAAMSPAERDAAVASIGAS